MNLRLRDHTLTLVKLGKQFPSGKRAIGAAIAVALLRSVFSLSALRFSGLNLPHGFLEYAVNMPANGSTELVLDKAGESQSERAKGLDNVFEAAAQVHRAAECQQLSKASKFCSRTPCQTHEKPVAQAVVSPDDTLHNSSARCKTLWFAGMHEGSSSHCDGGRYKNFYASALASARLNAKETLQPVLVLGRYGLNTSSAPSALAQWADKQGAIVIVLDKLSFQDHIPNHQMGVFIRLDIPNIVEENNLFSLPHICPKHVLYTDTDILFVNEIRQEDLNSLKATLTEGAYLSYGPERAMNSGPLNTGVMVIDVPGMASRMPSVQELVKAHPNFRHDQDLLNQYFKDKQSSLKLLPFYWNWKIYWTLEPSTWSDVKLIHFHGPKPYRGLKEIATCTEMPSAWKVYRRFWRFANCCGGSNLAFAAHELFMSLQPAFSDICPP